tara:strand:- start:130 stop:270 length:141 start_codon:yes stop_codon:yes gene_type:complete
MLQSRTEEDMADIWIAIDPDEGGRELFEPLKLIPVNVSSKLLDKVI